MTEPLYDYDPEAVLTSPEAITIFMADAFETDQSGITKNNNWGSRRKPSKFPDKY